MTIPSIDGITKTVGEYESNRVNKMHELDKGRRYVKMGGIEFESKWKWKND